MNLEEIIYKKITAECEKLILRHHKYHNSLHISWERKRKLFPGTNKKQIQQPEYWAIDKKFNPFYVHSNAKAIAKAIAKKIENRTYKPNKPHEKLIPKSGGGTRKLTIYQIPDAAVSKYFYTRLLAKNKHRFSSFSYAYRNDRNVHFAIQDIAVDLEQESRTFIAEFDFSDFFGSITHKYLFDQFEKNGFLISDEDGFIIKAFLEHRSKGIPQGTSISLFLANLTCWKLDKSFEKAGLKFARYADDTVVWSPDYASICRAFSIINDFSNETGVKINIAKSDGINLLTRDGLNAEISSKSSFDFLGYSVGVGLVSIKEKSILRIKKQISYLLYSNLIQPLKQQNLANQAIPANNRDKHLLSAIQQIRRYMYGGLMHKEITDFIHGRRKYIIFKGIMSFYPLLNDEDQLKSLDGWLVSIIYRSLKLRAKLLYHHGHAYSTTQFPFNVPRKNILEKFRGKIIYRKRLLEVPSFRLLFKALKKGLSQSGIEYIMHPESSKYNYKE